MTSTTTIKSATKAAETTEPDTRPQANIPKNKTFLTTLQGGELMRLEDETGVTILKAANQLDSGEMSIKFFIVAAWLFLRREDINTPLETAEALDFEDLMHYLRMDD